MPTSLYESNLGVNAILTNIAQRYTQPEFCMKLLYPLVEVGMMSGQIFQFDDSVYDEVDDNRADGDDYAEVEDGFAGKTFTLTSKGIKYKLPDKKRNQLGAMGYNWGQHAADFVMQKATFLHEVAAARLATTTGSYASTNRVTLSSGSQLNEAAVDPDPVIRTAKTAIADQIGAEPNVMILGRDAFNALAAKYARNFTNTAPNGLRQQLTEDILAGIFGFERVRVCGVIAKVAGVKTRVFGKDIVIARTNPRALNSDRTPYKTTGDIVPQEYSFGYTYVYRGNPLMYEPGRNEEKGYTYYKLDFDRSISQTGVNSSNAIISGYLIKDAVA
jgi:hypothetical protein